MPVPERATILVPMYTGDAAKNAILKKSPGAPRTIETKNICRKRDERNTSNAHKNTTASAIAVQPQ